MPKPNPQAMTEADKILSLSRELRIAYLSWKHRTTPRQIEARIMRGEIELPEESPFHRDVARQVLTFERAALQERTRKALDSVRAPEEAKGGSPKCFQ